MQQAQSAGTAVDTGALATAHATFVSTATTVINTAVTQLTPYIDSTQTTAFTTATQDLITKLSQMPQRGMMGQGMMNKGQQDGRHTMRRGPGVAAFFSTGSTSPIAQYIQTGLSSTDQATVDTIIQTAHDSLVQAQQTEKVARDSIIQGASDSTVDTGALATAHATFVSTATTIINTAVTQLTSYIDSTQTAAFTTATNNLIAKLSQTP